MNISILKNKSLYLAAVILATAFGLIIYPKECINAAISAVDLSAYTVVPSLLPFLVCSHLLLNTGFAKYSGKYLSFIMKPLFGVSGCSSTAFILGIVGGYPVGAKNVCELFGLGLITKIEAERLLSFCNNSGPLFIIGTVAACFYNNPGVGVILYGAHILGCVTVGILFRFYKKNEDIFHSVKCQHLEISKAYDFGKIFGSAVYDSVNTLLMICGFVIFFAVFITIIDKYGILNIFPDNVSPLLVVGFFEITNGLKKISADNNLPLYLKLILTSLVLGWGGMSVHFQVKTLISKFNISSKPYYIGKALQGVFAAAYTFIIIKMFPIVESAFIQNVNLLPVAIHLEIMQLFIVSVCLSLLCFATLAMISQIARLFSGRRNAPHKK